MTEPPDHARLRLIGAELHRLRKALPSRQRLIGGMEHGTMSATAALLAYLPTREIGLHDGFWAAITAIAVVQTEFNATRTTARDQFAGAAVGGVIAVAVLLVAGQHLLSYGAAVVLAVSTAWALNIASAARLAGSTATIVLLVPHGQSSAPMTAVARALEVGWGVSVAIAVVWLIDKVAVRVKARLECRSPPP